MADLYILDLDGVEGESQTEGFEKKIELLSMNDGLAAQVTGDVSNQERISGGPNFQDINATKYIDTSTPLLFQNCCEGKIFKSAKIFQLRNDAGKLIELQRWELENPVLSSYSQGGGSGDKPVDSLTINFSKIVWAYSVQNEAGGKAGEIADGHDVAKNVAAS